MSRVISDHSLLTWEVYPSGGEFGLPVNPKIVFHCLSDPDRRARYLEYRGDTSEAERKVQEATEDDLRRMLETSTELS